VSREAQLLEGLRFGVFHRAREIPSVAEAGGVDGRALAVDGNDASVIEDRAEIGAVGSVTTWRGSPWAAGPVRMKASRANAIVSSDVT
jgi:hypothetical protein